MACFTASGAPSGAAAWPKRRRARVPGTVGPDDGKIFAFADDTIMAKTAAPIRILGLRGYTSRFRSGSLCHKNCVCKEKSHFPKTFWSSLALVAAAVGGVGAVPGGVGELGGLGGLSGLGLGYH